MFSNRQYQHIPTDSTPDDLRLAAHDIDDQRPGTIGLAERLLKQWRFHLSALSATALVILGVILLIWYSSDSPARGTERINFGSVPSDYCGSTAVEARANGCVFDLVTNNWVPKRCADAETAQEFREWVSNNVRLRQSWPYYYDGHGERQIASEEEMAGMVGQLVYTTTENHLGHCTFLMRRLHRFLDSDAETAISRINFNHTLHCSSEVLRAVGNPECEDRGIITSAFLVGITGC
ncbi:hypothetical protein AARAC_004626 [Aspergillus arachidicola]|uniref:Uncharacterized protein n=1 Tax=Aspergillus arachidicola TaxID=656916 RepID=A0A2G7G6E3_9EURO|nr:hypothetical protein AARAC_004626 [Aspergillus arachidicola]